MPRSPVWSLVGARRRQPINVFLSLSHQCFSPSLLLSPKSISISLGEDVKEGRKEGMKEGKGREGGRKEEESRSGRNIPWHLPSTTGGARGEGDACIYEGVFKKYKWETFALMMRFRYDDHIQPTPLPSYIIQSNYLTSKLQFPSL